MTGAIRLFHFFSPSAIWPVPFSAIFGICKNIEKSVYYFGLFIDRFGGDKNGRT